MLRLTPNLVSPTCADLQSTISNHRWVSPLVLSSIPPMPLDNRIRMSWVRSPSCAAISRGILYGRPVLGLLGSVSSSAVWCPAARRWGTAFKKACSPVHSRSHCSFSMCHTPASHWSLLPPTASILCLSRLSSRVALAQLVPRRSSGGPGISTGMLSSCEHFATRAHLLSSALSHFHISISSVSSRSELHAHCSHARLRSRSVSCRATSSCLRHRCTWRHSSCASTQELCRPPAGDIPCRTVG
jgi:hypothetical protein